MSNTIYDGTKYHYVYKITELSTNIKYIGIRTSIVDPIYDLGIKYFSSSSNKEFIKNQKSNPDNYKYDILSIHDTRSAANIEEIRLHELYDVSKSEYYYNKSRSTSHHFTTDGFVVVKDINGNTMHVSVNDPRYLSGELKHNSTGMVVVKSADGNNITISVDDPRYLSGELKGIAHGFVVAKDKYGKNIQVSANDPRLISGEIFGLTKGKVSVIDTKTNITLNVDKDDPRLLSGEFVGVARGRKKCFNTITKKYTTSYPDDIRFTTGELVKYEKIKCVRNKNRDHNIGKKWYNNGESQCITYDPSTLHGEGWVEGMLTIGKKWFNNGIIEILAFNKNELEGINWVKGRLKKNGL